MHKTTTLPPTTTMAVDNDVVVKLTSIDAAVWLQTLLLLCGDVESNPGPKPAAREAKPDKAKIMADKVDAHDAKLEELEALVKSQAELIEELTKKQVDLVAQLDEKQVELRQHLEANKVEAVTSIEQLKVALESDLRRTSSNLTLKIDDQKVMEAAGSMFCKRPPIHFLNFNFLIFCLRLFVFRAFQTTSYQTNHY